MQVIFGLSNQLEIIEQTREVASYAEFEHSESFTFFAIFQELFKHLTLSFAEDLFMHSRHRCDVSKSDTLIFGYRIIISYGERENGKFER